MPTQMQFNDIIQKLEHAYNFYFDTPYRFNEYEIYLSNGEKLQFNFPTSRMPHLLGIQLGNIQDSRILSSVRSEDVWREVIDRSTYIYQKCLKGEASYYSLFSNFMEEKLEYFEKVLKMDFDRIQFVCQYDKALSYLLGDGKQYGCDYYICFQDDQQQYYFLGIIYDEKIGRLMPASLLSSSEKRDDQELLYEIIHNQRILLCNSVCKKNINSMRRIPLNEKVEKLARLIQIANDNGAVLDVSQEALYLSKLAQRSISESGMMKQSMHDIMVSLQAGRRINSGLGEPFDQFIEIMNDRLLLGDATTTELLKEFSQLRQTLVGLENAIHEKDSQIQILQEQLIQKDLTIAEQDERMEHQEQKIADLTDFQQDAFQLYKKYYKADE